MLRLLDVCALAARRRVEWLRAGPDVDQHRSPRGDRSRARALMHRDLTGALDAAGRAARRVSAARSPRALTATGPSRSPSRALGRRAVIRSVCWTASSTTRASLPVNSSWRRDRGRAAARRRVPPLGPRAARTPARRLRLRDLGPEQAGVDRTRSTRSSRDLPARRVRGALLRQASCICCWRCCRPRHRRTGRASRTGSPRARARVPGTLSRRPTAEPRLDAAARPLRRA